MEIQVTKKVKVPLSPFCGRCLRVGIDGSYNFCTLHDRFIYRHQGQLLKCRECYDALYDAIEKME